MGQCGCHPSDSVDVIRWGSMGVIPRGSVPVIPGVNNGCRPNSTPKHSRTSMTPHTPKSLNPKRLTQKLTPET
eukprot:260208-Chlamydomonas_euryale.AAC.3